MSGPVYGRGLDSIRMSVAEEYFAPDRVALLAAAEPRVVMGNLLLAINRAVAVEQARGVGFTPLLPLRRVEWTEVLEAIRALHTVRLLVLPDRTEVLGLYDEDPDSPTYRVFDRRHRWLHRLVSRYSDDGSARGVGNVAFHLRTDQFERGSLLSVDDVAQQLTGGRR